MIKLAMQLYNQLSQPSRIRAVIFSSGGLNAHQKPNLANTPNPVVYALGDSVFNPWSNDIPLSLQAGPSAKLQIPCWPDAILPVRLAARGVPPPFNEL